MISKVNARYIKWIGDVNDSLVVCSGNIGRSADHFVFGDWSYNWYNAFIAGMLPREAIDQAYRELDRLETAVDEA